MCQKTEARETAPPAATRRNGTSRPERSPHAAAGQELTGTKGKCGHASGGGGVATATAATATATAATATAAAAAAAASALAHTVQEDIAHCV